MILGALDDAGGQDYLAEQAHKNPAAFMALLGKVLPPEPRGDPLPPVITFKMGLRDLRPPAEMKDVSIGAQKGPRIGVQKGPPAATVTVHGVGRRAGVEPQA
jgi:hypothetical protein